MAKLARPICRHGYFKILPRPLSYLIEASREKRVFQIAYHQDRKGLKYSDDCPIEQFFEELGWEAIRKTFTNPRQLVPHRCDSRKGASGSPMLLKTPKGPVVVGMDQGNFWIKRNKKKKRRKKYILNIAVGAMAFHEQINLLRAETSPPTVGSLKEVQELLQATGDYKGRIDGVYGNQTRQAILDFERRHKLTVTGRPTQSVLATLRSNGSKAPPEKAVAAFEAYLYNPQSKDFRAFAVDPKTGASGSFGYYKWHPNSAIKRAMEECGWKSKNCELYAVGGTVVFGLSQELLASVIKDYIAKIGLPESFQEYLGRKKFKDFKAFALDSKTGRFGRSFNYKWHPKSAIKGALKACGTKSNDCELFAVGDRIVFGLSKELLATAIENYFAKIDPSTSFQEYLQGERYKDFKAFAVKPGSGYWGRAWGYSSPYMAINSALKRCSEKGGECKLYAVGNVRVLGKSETEVQKAIEAYRVRVVEELFEGAKK